MSFSRAIEGVAKWSACRPRMVLVGAALVVALSVFSLSRSSVDATLTGMIGGDNPAATALARVADRFNAAEDLILLISTAEGTPRDESRRLLLDYAERFEALASADPEARAAMSGVRWRPDPSAQEFMQSVMLPAGLYYLDDEGVEALLARLERDAVGEELARSEAMLAAPGPGAGALARELARDPLHLLEFVQSRMGGRPPGAGEPEFSGDGGALLIRVSGVRPVNDIEFSKSFTAAIERVAQAANTDGLIVRTGGGYAVAAISATAIRADAISSSIGAIVMLGLFFVIMFRSAAMPLIILVSAGIGIVAAFGVYTAAQPLLTPLTTVLAAMLAGLGVDYAIHFIAHREAIASRGETGERASARTAGELAAPLGAACLTTIFGFAAISLADVRMLQDFSLLGCMGLIGSLVSVLLVLPALLAVLPAGGPRGVFVRAAERVVGVVSTRRRTSLAAGGVVLLGAAAGIALTPGFFPPFETDTAVIHPRPNTALETGQMARDRFAGAGEQLLVHVSAPTDEELIVRAHAVAAALGGEAAREAGIESTLGLATFIPDPRDGARRSERLARVDVEAVLAGVSAEMEESAFDASAFTDYLEFLRRLLGARAAPTMSDIRGTPGLANQLLPAHSEEPETIVLLSTNRSAAEPAARGVLFEEVRELIAPVEGATLTGVTVVSLDFERAIRRDLSRFLAVSLGLVIIWLTIAMRNAADVLLAFVPVAFGAVVLAAVLSVAGEKLNTVNIIAMPLLAGIAIDSGILLVFASRRGESLSQTVLAIFCTGVTTMLGFGTLVASHTPAVQSLGLAALTGVAASLAGSILVLVPLLVHRRRRGSVSGELDAGGMSVSPDRKLR